MSCRSVAFLSRVGVILIGATAPVAAQTREDSAAVRQTALDYVEGFYTGDTLRLQRAVHPNFYKYGWFRSGEDPYQGEQMKWGEVMAYAADVRAAKRPVPDSWPRAIQVLDQLDQTAAVKLTARWGTDYLLLAKYDGAWKISQVLWQTPMRTGAVR